MIPQDLLRKYIMFAREKIRPKLFDLDQEKLARLFADLRRESIATGSIPITVRHLESMIRMAEASAKIHLREYVRGDDVDLAISVMVGSFVSAQKTSIKRTLERVCYFLAASFIEAQLLTRKTFRASASTSPRPETTKNCWRSFWARWSRTRPVSTSSSMVGIRTKLQLACPSLMNG